MYTDIYIVLGYIAKYYSKTEKKTELYETLMRNLFLCIFHRTLFISFVSRLINKLVSERDWTVQEVYYHLLNFSLVEDSRVVLDIDCRLPGGRSRSVIINKEEIYETTSVYEKYIAYDVNWAESFYFHILTYINTKRIL